MPKGLEVDLGPDVFFKRLFLHDCFLLCCLYKAAAAGVNGPPAVDAALLQGVQGLLPEGVVGAAAFPDELFGLLAHGHAVGGAAALTMGRLSSRTAHCTSYSVASSMGRMRVRSRWDRWVTGEKQPMRPSRQRFM